MGGQPRFQTRPEMSSLDRLLLCRSISLPLSLRLDPPQGKSPPGQREVDVNICIPKGISKQMQNQKRVEMPLFKKAQTSFLSGDTDLLMVVTALYLTVVPSSLNCDFVYCFGAICCHHLTSGFSDQQDCVAAKSLRSVFTVPSPPSPPRPS